MDKKYIIHPGWVYSITDGERHYITAYQLMNLYHVQPSECIIDRDEQSTIGLRGKFIHLHPRGDGDYSLDV